jgi:hypothetical protein
MCCKVGKKNWKANPKTRTEIIRPGRDIIAEDEPGELGQSFNKMADDPLKSYTALQESEERYRGFS